MRIDCHCDTIMYSRKESLWYHPERHCDFARLKETVDIQFMAVFPYLDQVLPQAKEAIPMIAQEMVGWILEGVQMYPENVGLIQNQQDIAALQKAGKLGILVGIEGGESLGGNLQTLDTLFALGVRLVGLTWNYENELAWGCGCDKNQKETDLMLVHDGLKPFGAAVIKRAEQLGMIVDLAHISYHGFWRALDVAQKPVLVSHGNCYALCPHVRNLRDEQLKALAEVNGVLGISFVPGFLNATVDACVEDILRHMDYGVEVAGIEHIGIGSDFDGVEQLPQGVTDTCFLTCLAEALDKRGYREQDRKKIMGDNVLRVIKANLPQLPCV